MCLAHVKKSQLISKHYSKFSNLVPVSIIGVFDVSQSKMRVKKIYQNKNMSILKVPIPSLDCMSWHSLLNSKLLICYFVALFVTQANNICYHLFVPNKRVTTHLLKLRNQNDLVLQNKRICVVPTFVESVFIHGLPKRIWHASILSTSQFTSSCKKFPIDNGTL